MGRERGVRVTSAFPVICPEADGQQSVSLDHSEDSRERLRWVDFCQSASEPELA